MGAVYEEFLKEMASLRRRYAHRPRKELIHLLLLALEREEIVSISYRESLMAHRLQSMPLDDATRELIRHALVWIWKDEEMHTVYVRGAILKLGSFWLRKRAGFTQMAGGIGGWASSVLQHLTWAQAPVSRGIASLITLAGRLVGKVPASVMKELRFSSFREFCQYNVDAEQTAAECWQRLVELAERDPDLTPNAVDEFRRVVEDERRHQRVFAILRDALDENDRLIDSETVDSLASKIGEVGSYFLPRSRRAELKQNPIGSGAPVWCALGKCSQDKTGIFQQLLKDAGLVEQLEARARSLNKPIHEMRVAIKPTFMLGYHRNDLSPITDPELIEELARQLRALGVADVALIENPNIYNNFYARRSVQEVANYFGFQSEHYRLVDSSEEQIEHTYFRGMGQYTVARTWKEADFRITFSKLRSHPIEIALLSVGNVEWLGGGCDQYIFADRQAERETAVMMILDAFPPHFALVEGYDCAPDGMVGVMGCRRPKALRRIYASHDALALDLVVLRHLGIKCPNESTILESARHWFGETSQIEVHGCDESIRGWRGPYSSDFSTLLCFLALPMYRHASGRGALFTSEMDEKAFPPLQPPGMMLQMGRSVMRTILGLWGIARRSPKQSSQSDV